jgi:hypothetical protein
MREIRKENKCTWNQKPVKNINKKQMLSLFMGNIWPTLYLRHLTTEESNSNHHYIT